MEITLYLAFIAGLVSFISPCVLPLVPAYVGYMGGRMTHTVATSAVHPGGRTTSAGLNQRFVTFIHSLFFIGGFALVFVGIGLLSTAFVSVVGGQNISALTDLIGRIGGIIIIFFGLHFMGVLPRWLAQFRINEVLLSNQLTSIGFAFGGGALILWGFSGNVLIWESTLWTYAFWVPLIGLASLGIFIAWLFLAGAFTDPVVFWNNTVDRITTALYTDTRQSIGTLGKRDQGYGSSAIMGIVFSAGWTPCIGPVYGTVLTMAANGGDVAQAGMLLAAYSLGLGIPFMLTALALDSAQTLLRKLQRHMRKVELASGVFLIVIGLLVASGQLQSLSATLSQGDFAVVAINLEEQVIGAVIGSDRLSSDNDAETTGSSQTIITNPETVKVAPTGTPAVAATAVPNLTPDTETAVQAVGSGPSVGISLGNLAPDFETISDRGEHVKLSDHRGEIVLLNFWATWCGPCRIEMPEFEAIYETRKDEGFVIIAVNNAESITDVQGFRYELGLNFTLAMDERANIQNQYNIFSYPSTFILDKDGTILARHFGPLTTDQINDLVDNALAF